MFLLSRLARYYGRMVQAKMVKHHGALHTTMILRHSDATLSGDTKARYHAFFRKMGFEIPTAEQEQADPGGADGKYSAAVDWLRQKTDDERKFRRLKDENIDFGFRRNLLGLKPIALVAALVALVMNSLMIWRHWPSEDHITIGAVLEALFIGASLLWLFVVRMPFVEDAARSYAVRLLAECDNLSPTPRRTRGPS
jgi:hypothetical protein